MPAGLGGIAARAFADQHQPGGAPGLGRQLQAATCGQGHRLLRLGDDQARLFVAHKLKPVLFDPAALKASGARFYRP